MVPSSITAAVNATYIRSFDAESQMPDFFVLSGAEYDGKWAEISGFPAYVLVSKIINVTPKPAFRRE